MLFTQLQCKKWPLDLLKSMRSVRLDRHTFLAIKKTLKFIIQIIIELFLSVHLLYNSLVRNWTVIFGMDLQLMPKKLRRQEFFKFFLLLYLWYGTRVHAFIKYLFELFFEYTNQWSEVGQLTFGRYNGWSAKFETS